MSTPKKESGYEWGIRKRKEYSEQLLAKHRAALRLALEEEKQTKQKAKQSRRKKQIRVQTSNTFPVNKVHRLMKGSICNDEYASRISAESAAYLSGVLEAIAWLELQAAGDFAIDDKRNTILPTHVMLALRTNKELDEVCKNGGVIIPFAGVFPTTEPGPQRKR